MFKRTAEKLTELKETTHELNVNVVVDIDPMTKSFIKTFLVLTGISVAAHAVNAYVDSRSSTSDENPN